MDSLLAKLHEALIIRRLTVATAESCTGGMLATLLTERPGSSAYFVGGVSAYANSVKVGLLDVPEESIKRHGAVSAEVAEAMARGARDRLEASYALALTGVAGPDGGTPQKPVGTVFAGVAGPSGVRSLRLALSGDRGAVRRAAAEACLRELLKEIGG